MGDRIGPEHAPCSSNGGGIAMLDIFSDGEQPAKTIKESKYMHFICILVPACKSLNNFSSGSRQN